MKNSYNSSISLLLTLPIILFLPSLLLGQIVSWTAEGDATFWSDAIKMVSGNAISTEPGGDEIPQQFTLEQNYPNPFNPTTTIHSGLLEGSEVRITVYNTMVREVATLIQNETRTAGWYNAIFNASNLSSGVYIYRLQKDESSESAKLTLIK